MDVYLIRDALQAARVRAEIQVVSDGQAATAFFDRVDANENVICPSLVLLDMNLPKKSGVEVLIHLRASARCRGAAVLVVSSSDEVRERSAVFGLGIAGYFKKPSEYEGFMKLGLLVLDLLKQPGPTTPS
jgi:two-component system, chemotaxis family, response regulator Rcp1